MYVDSLEQRFRQKARNNKITLSELKNILRQARGLLDPDFESLSDYHLSDNVPNELTFDEASDLVKNFTNDAKKVSEVQSPISHFLYESLVTVRNGQVTIEQVGESAIDTSFNFTKILGEQFQRKLVNAEQYGIIS